jgi:hypothetical protein
MAELDLLNYPGSKLGSITSPAPSVFKPETKQTPLGPEPEPSASDGYLKAVEPFQKKYEEAIKAETELTSAQKEQELRSEAIRQKSNADALRAETETIKNNDVLKQRNEIDGKLIDAAFVPRQDNAQDLATLFSLINVVGVAIGSGGKGNAMQAMSAMNGMAEGYQKGRADLYKKEKDQFDINIKALKNKSEILSKRLAEIAVLASKDKEAARIEADVLFNEQGADFYKQHAKQFGIASTAKIAKENFNAASKAYELGLQQHQKQEDSKRADQRHKEDLQSRERLRIATLNAQQGRTKSDRYGFSDILATASNEAAASMKNIMGLDVTSSAGFFGGKVTNSLFTAPADAFANTITSESAQRYNIEAGKLSFSLSQLMKGGRVVGATEVAEMDKFIKIKEGDSIESAATKLAEARQMAERAIEVRIKSPNTPPELKEVYRENLDTIQKVIPFTVDDINKFVKQKNDVTTFGEELVNKYKEEKPATQTQSAPTKTSSGATVSTW